MAEMMKLVRVHGPGDMRLDDVPVPVPGPRDVVVRVLASGICGSDLGYVAQGGLGGAEPLKEPLPIGHEFAGVVESVGGEVEEGIRPGLRCAVNPDDGYIGGGGPEGAMAPFILIPNARIGSTLFPIPDALSADRAALAEPLSVALHGINIAQVTPESRVAVLGAGPIGLSAVVMLRHKGVKDIVAVDLSDARLEKARQLGATATVNPLRQPMAEALGELHGKGERFGVPYVGTDVFLDAAGSIKALEDAFDVAKFRAKLIIIALYKKPLQLNLFKMMANEILISGSIAVERHAEFGECLDMLAKGEIDVEPLISHRIAFERVDEAFKIAADADASAKVMLTFGERA
ncbi:MAG TPA: zinc-binding dehydrogenase [Pedomonas sp.]|uniref:zinc-dependent alcohol dehydrogenase n=1 Tax=Pedomonas sp. TaxID=2976421 RepID=UPI002F42381B